MRYYDVHRTVNTTFTFRKRKNGSPMGTITSTFRNTATRSNVMDEIEQVRQVLDAVPVWSSFRNKHGHLIEKVTFEHTDGNVRLTDTFWINKGYVGN